MAEITMTRNKRIMITMNNQNYNNNIYIDKNDDIRLNSNKNFREQSMNKIKLCACNVLQELYTKRRADDILIMERRSLQEGRVRGGAEGRGGMRGKELGGRGSTEQIMSVRLSEGGGGRVGLFVFILVCEPLVRSSLSFYFASKYPSYKTARK